MTYSRKILASTAQVLIIAVLTLTKEAFSAAKFYEYKVLQEQTALDRQVFSPDLSRIIYYNNLQSYPEVYSLYTFQNINTDPNAYRLSQVTDIKFYLDQDGNNNILYSTNYGAIEAKTFKGGTFDADLYVTNIDDDTTGQCQRAESIEVSSDGSMWFATCLSGTTYVGELASQIEDVTALPSEALGCRINAVPVWRPNNLEILFSCYFQGNSSASIFLYDVLSNSVEMLNIDGVGIVQDFSFGNQYELYILSNQFQTLNVYSFQSQQLITYPLDWTYQFVNVRSNFISLIDYGYQRVHPITETNFSINNAIFDNANNVNRQVGLAPDGSVYAKKAFNTRTYYKLCEKSYYNATDELCRPCDQNCLDCRSNSTKCVSCHDGYALDYDTLTCKEEGGVATWVIVVSVIAGVIVIAGVAGVIIYKRRVKFNAEKEEDNEEYKQLEY